MMIEVVKGVASRCQKNSQFRFGKKQHWSWSSGVEVSLTIKGWEAPCTFEMMGESCMDEFNKTVEAVGAKCTVKKLNVLGTYYSTGMYVPQIIRTIAAHVDQQGGILSNLEFEATSSHLCSGWNLEPNFLALIKSSKEWMVQRLSILPFQDCLFPLVWNSANGRIGTLTFLVHDGYSGEKPSNLLAARGMSRQFGRSVKK